MRHPFTLLTLGIFIALIFLGVWIRGLAPDRLLNARFARLSFASALMVLLEFGLRGANSYEQARFWSDLNFFWPALVLGALELTLGFKPGARRPKSWWALALGGALTFAVLELTTGWVTEAPVPLSVGWYYGPPGISWVGTLNQLWTGGMILTALMVGTSQMFKARAYAPGELVAFSSGYSVALLFALWHFVMIQRPAWLDNEPRPPALPLGLLAGLALVTVGLFLDQRRRAERARLKEEQEIAETLKGTIEARARRLIETHEELQEMELRASELREELRVMREELPLGRALSGVAHDLKNVYSAIDGAAQLISLTLNDDPRGALEQIRAAVREGRADAEQLLTMARMRPVRCERFELNGLLRRCLPTLHRLIGGGLRLELSPQREALTVASDPQELERALMFLALLIGERAEEGERLHISTSEAHGAGVIVFIYTPLKSTKLTAGGAGGLDDAIKQTLALLRERLGPSAAHLTQRVTGSQLEVTLNLPQADISPGAV